LRTNSITQREDSPPLGGVELSRVAFEQRLDERLATGRLEQFDCLQIVGHLREQGLQILGLFGSRFARHADQLVQPAQGDERGYGGTDRDRYRDRERQSEVDDAFNHVPTDHGHVFVAGRCALGFGCERVRGAPGSQAREVTPARGHQRLKHFEPQVGGDPGHRVTDLTIGEKGHAGLQTVEERDDRQQHGQ
jgi:hypothetical protein